MCSWTPESWQQYPYTQEVQYPSAEKLAEVVTNLSKVPPLVTAAEVDALRHQIAHASQGKGFLLQGGDCAELFDECSATGIKNKLKILLQMSLILVHGLRKYLFTVIVGGSVAVILRVLTKVLRS